MQQILLLGRQQSFISGRHLLLNWVGRVIYVFPLLPLLYKVVQKFLHHPMMAPPGIIPNLTLLLQIDVPQVVSSARPPSVEHGQLLGCCHHEVPRLALTPWRIKFSDRVTSTLLNIGSSLPDTHIAKNGLDTCSGSHLRSPPQLCKASHLCSTSSFI